MMSEQTGRDHRHVAVLAFPFATHPGLLLGLVRTLAVAAPTITFSFFSTAESNLSLFSRPTSGSIRPYAVPDGVPEGYAFKGRPQEDIEFFLTVAPDTYRKGVERAEIEMGMKVSCVVADAFLWFSGEIAEEYGVPWVPVWTSAAGSLAIHCYTDLIRQNVGLQGITGREDEILKFIPGFQELRLGDLPMGVVSGNLNSPFSAMLHRMGQTIPKATAIPINSFAELDPPIVHDLKSKFNNILHVGPFNLTSPPPSATITDEYGCIDWLDRQKQGSVAYVGFGTVAVPPPHELKAIAEALEESDTPYLWSLKDNFRCHLPGGFLKRTSEKGKIVPWAPQVKVLAHVSTGVFINHGGWNSVLESISAGVPLIVRPFFGDHQLNSWMVEKVWQIGVRTEGGIFTKDAVVNALELVLSSEKSKIFKERIGMYRELALEAVGPNGSSTQDIMALLEVINSASP